MSQGDFYSIHAQGFVRVAAATPRASSGDVAANLAGILAMAGQADAGGADIVVFPELCLSSYAIDDLLLQDALLDAVEVAATTLIEESARLAPVLLVGAPVRAQRAALQLRARHRARAATRHRPQELSAELSRIL